MTRRLPGAMLLLALCVTLFSSATATPSALLLDPPPDAPTLSGHEVVLDDAEEFAKLHGVSIEQALIRLDLQMNAIPRLENAIAAEEASRYGGLVIQNAPDYRVLVLLTSGAKADVERYVDDRRLSEIVEVRRVARTLGQLEAAQKRAHALRQFVPFDSDIDVLSNRVRLHVAATSASELDLKTAALRAEAARTGAPLPAWVVVSGVPQLTRPALDVFGGLSLYSCTSGFSVTGAGGSGGVTTAGHCDNDLAYATWPLNFKSELTWSSYDIQWHSRPDTNWPAKIYRGQGVYGPISGKKARWNQPIGATVCKRGITSDRTCGAIFTKSFAPSSIPNVEATFIGAEAGTQPGDSGGPVFVGEEAWGMTVGYNFVGYVIYMASNYIESSFGLYIRGT